MRLEKKYWIAIVCKMCVILTTFFISIFLNRGLGVESKGEYQYVVNLVELLYVLLSVGIGQTYSTFLRSQGNDNCRETFITLGWIHAIIILLIGGFFVVIRKPDYGLTIVILTSIAVLKIIISMIAVVENSVQRNIIQSIIDIVHLIILSLLYFSSTCTLTNVLICYALNDIVKIIALVCTYKMKPSLKNLECNFLKNVYKTGIVTMVVMLLINVNYYIDTIMLNAISNTYHMGIYSVAVTFANMFLLIPDAFKEVLFGDSIKKDFRKVTVINSIKISLLASIVILIGFIVFGKFMIEFLYGAEYAPSYSLTLILFIGSLFMIFFKILQPVYISHGSQKKAAIFLSISATMNIVTNYFMIPKYDSKGAAMASAVSYGVCGVLFLIDYLRIPRTV